MDDASLLIALLPGDVTFDTAHPLQWLWVAGVLLVLYLGVAAALRLGVQRMTGLPGWSGAGVLLGFWGQVVAFIGFVWDVTWHVDLGRDSVLFTVPHVLILLGLAGIGCAALLSIALATRAGAGAGLRLGRIRAPYAAIALGLLAAGALAGFPLDDWWHQTYGIDVTMWSPTHLMMIGGASLSPIALWLLVAEAGPAAMATRAGRVARYRLAAVVLIGLSTFQLEFDLGIPQWQMLYQPALIAAGGAIALVAARTALGRGSALLAGVGFLVTRALLALLIGPGLGHTLPRIPLYLGMAAGIELAFWIARRRPPILQALLAGLLGFAAGVPTELLWNRLWFPLPWSQALLPYIWIPLVMALAGAIVGMGLGRVLSWKPVRVPAGLIVPALAVMAGLLAIHVPLRHADPGSATLTATVRGDQAQVAVTLDPASVPAGADWFRILAWQGGGLRDIPLVETSPGHYHSTAPIPVGGKWKSMLVVARGDVLEAVPIALPVDLQYGLPAIPAPVRPRHETFVPATQLMLRESHGGSSIVSLVVEAAFLALILLWAAALCLAGQRIGRGTGGGPRSDSHLRRAPSTKLATGAR
jgi:hypothetical protein